MPGFRPSDLIPGSAESGHLYPHFYISTTAVPTTNIFISLAI